jgi:casein kinase 1
MTNISVQTSSALLAQAHANASAAATPQRERHREHAHRRISRQGERDATASPGSGLVLSPTPAHIKSQRRPAGDGRTNSRDLSNAAIPPASRRQSTQQGGALNATTGTTGTAAGSRHPYAAAPSSPAGYAAYAGGRTSFAGQPAAANGNGLAASGDAFGYGTQQGTQNGAANAGARGMNVYDGAQMERGPDADEHGGRKKGFWSSLCCAA